MLGNSLVPAQLAVSQEGLSSMELVSFISFSFVGCFTTLSIAGLYNV
jgi:hypothetical protein